MDEQQKQIIEDYIKSYNRFDVAGMIRHLHENVVFQNISNGQVDLETKGINEFKRQAEAATQYFDQRKQIIESWDFAASKVLIKISYEATLSTDLPNGLKKGDTLTLQGTSEFEFENGKIKSIKDKS